MDSELILRITSIKKNLDLQLEDLEYRKQKVEVELYYDTIDVHNAVLGSRVFYPPFENSFPTKKFNEKATLVRSLLASGWLGKIRLLPPHQAEFLNKLKFDFGVDIVSDPKGAARNFLRDIGFKNAERIIPQAIESLTQDQVIEFIKDQAGFHERLFKAIQCMVPWHRRIARWEANHTLSVEKQRPRYDEIIQSDDFKALKDAFDEKRSATPVNNFADAVAATILIQRVKDFNSGQRVLSRFYVSTEVFEEVFHETGINAKLEYKNPFGGQSSVLCNADYFIYKAAFIPRPDSRFKNQTFEAAEEYLNDLSGKVSDLLAVQEELTVEALNEIKDLAGKPLSEIIQDLQQFSFLENVWLKFDAPQDIDEALREILETSRELANQGAFQQRVADAIRFTAEKLNTNVEEYKWISSIWNRVDRGAQGLRTRIRQGSLSSEEYFRDLGLFRYGFPSNTHENIRDLLEELITNDETENTARISIITSAYRGLRKPTKDINRLISATAAMLASRMYREIIFVLNKISPLPHSSLKVVLAECLFKEGRKKDKCVELIDSLKTEYAGTTGAKRAELAVGIAYLLFRLWKSYGNRTSWKRLPSERPPKEPGNSKYLKEAIKLAHEAYELFDSSDLMKKVYAMNQYLYYMVEHRSSELKNEMDRAAEELISYRSDVPVWQYRFDDTLSRYFHFLAIEASTAVEWDRFLTKAEGLNTIASNESKLDEDVLEHSDQLAMTRSQGYQS